jgi:hypothetical protein
MAETLAFTIGKDEIKYAIDTCRGNNINLWKQRASNKFM